MLECDRLFYRMFSHFGRPIHYCIMLQPAVQNMRSLVTWYVRQPILMVTVNIGLLSNYDSRPVIF